MNILNSAIVTFVKVLPKSVVHIFAKKYIAGASLDDAVNVTKELNAKGIMATMDVLGESITSKNEAIEAQKECLETLDAIRQHNLDANLSVKPTQMGLMLDEEFAFNMFDEILGKADPMNNFVRIDMEDSETTDRTIRLFNRLKEKYKGVGIVVQSYLKRTMDDVIELNKNGTNYRLCKGIYVEPEEIAFKSRQKVRDNFRCFEKNV